MGNNITKIDIAADIPAVRITREDIRKHFCPLATDQEVAMGLNIVKSLNLNPFLREVHFIKYDQKSKMSIVVGYEVYLKRAERSGKLDGWKAGINKAENFAWVEIYRKDWKEPFRWEVNLDEFNKKQSTWNQIPSFMGRKVAIAQGFRLAFPDELAGLPYTEEEHQVYDIKSEPEMKPEVKMPKELPPPAVEQEERKEEAPSAIEQMAVLAFKKNKNKWLAFLGEEFGVEKSSELSEEQILKCSEKLTAIIKENKGA